MIHSENIFYYLHNTIHLGINPHHNALQIYINEVIREGSTVSIGPVYSNTAVKIL